MVSRSTLVGLFFCVLAMACATAIAFFVHLEKTQESGARRLLLPEAAQFTSFRYQTDTFDLRCRQNDRGEWIVEHPFEARANAEVIQQFLDAVACEKVHDQISRSRRRKRGLDALLKDVARLEFVPHDAPPISLQLKEIQGEASMLFAEGTLPEVASGSLLVLDPAFREKWPVFADDFRDNHLIPWKESRICRMEIRREGAPLVSFHRTSSGWTLSQAPDPSGEGSSAMHSPTLYSGSEADINHLLRYLAGQRFVSLHRQGPPTPEILANIQCSATNSLFSIRLRSEDAAENTLDRELRFGSEILASDDLQGIRPTAIYVYIPNDDVLAAIDPSILASFLIDPERFRNHTLFHRATPENILSIRAQDSQGAVILFQRQTPSAPWRLIQPAQLPIEEAPFEAFLHSLLSLSDLSLAPLPDPSNATNAPIATVELTLQGGATLTAKIHPSSAPDSLLCALEGEPYARAFASPSLPIRPWIEADILPLLKPALPARILALAPPSIKDYGLLPAIETRTTQSPDDTPSPLVILLGNTTPSGDRYAMIRGTYTVYSIPTNVLETLVPTPSQETRP